MFPTAKQRNLLTEGSLTTKFRRALPQKWAQVSPRGEAALVLPNEV